ARPRRRALRRHSGRRSARPSAGRPERSSDTHAHVRRVVKATRRGSYYITAEARPLAKTDPEERPMLKSTLARAPRWSLGLLLAAGLAGALWTMPGRSAERATVIPAPAVDAEAGTGQTQTVVLAGGCFWGVQAVFQHVKGVTKAVSGYAGGSKDTARYNVVSSGTTGHAESVQITYDPRQISYGRILQIYFSVAHNPTQLNRPR